MIVQKVEIKPLFKVDMVPNENGTVIVRLEVGPLPDENVAKMVAEKLIDLITAGDKNLSTRLDTTTPN